MISEEIVHVKGHPKKLVIFLHGYIDSAPALDRKISRLVDGLEDVAVHIPQAPLVCEIHENKRQWYSMHRFDPDDARKFVPTMDECVAIYDRMGLGLAEAYSYLCEYIQERLDEYGLDAEDLYLCGFSQGAMLAIYTSVMFPQRIGGCVSFSGIITPHTYLAKHWQSHPEFLLIHGNADNLVRPEALNFTKKQLEKIGCPVKTYIVNEGQHKVTEDGLAEACGFINQRFIKKVAV